MVLAALLLPSIMEGQVRHGVELQAEVNGRDVLLFAIHDQEVDAAPVLQAVWRGVPDGMAVFQLLPSTAPSPGMHLMLDRLVEAALGAYLDRHIRFERHGVVPTMSADRMVVEMDAMVLAAADEFGARDLFSGFSAATREQLQRLVAIDWAQVPTGIDASGQQDPYLAIYFLVRSQRNELERQIRADLLPLASVQVWGEEVTDGRAQVRINSTCGTVFDEENYLCALDLQLADTGTNGLDPELGLSIMQSIEERRMEELEAAPEQEVRIRKRDRWLKGELDRINERIDRMDQRKELWALRDRMDDIEGRLTDLSLEVSEVREEQRNKEQENPLADLSDLAGRNITVRFDRNSVALEPDYRLLLNEVFEQLARSPEDRVLITGYTDRSGDAQLNLRLSEQRAKAVRNYLLQRGIAPERLLVNYYGDSRSLGRDPNERRVEVEWLR